MPDTGVRLSPSVTSLVSNQMKSCGDGEVIQDNQQINTFQLSSKNAYKMITKKTLFLGTT